MTRPRQRIVLFLPRRIDPARGVRESADLLPLGLLQIATLPDRDGYEVVIVDSLVEGEPLPLLLELCDGALLLGISCILGYQVTHGTRVARAIRERFPSLPIVWGGWFPSVLPERFLEEGVADAVCVGQGELTFRDVVEALASGADWADVRGLVVRRDGEVLRAPPRAVHGFEELPDVPWHLLDYEAYAALQQQQRRAGAGKARHRYADPPGVAPGAPLRGFCYHSSFGCPRPCTFCCSPAVSGRRWKAIPGALLAERVLECHERFRFDVLNFHDANFGVSEERSNDFCRGLESAGAPFRWSAAYEVESIDRYAGGSLDRLAASRCYLAVLGAEAASAERQAAIGKNLEVDRILESSLRRLHERGMQSSVSWIIGYPGETAEAMNETLDLAARIKQRFPGSPSDVFPFWAIPGCDDHRRAVEFGWELPRSLEEWGSWVEYKLDSPNTSVPEAVRRRWRRYCVASTFYDGLAHEGPRALREVMRRISGWRLRTGRFGFPIEQRVFHAIFAES